MRAGDGGRGGEPLPTAGAVERGPGGADREPARGVLAEQRHRLRGAHHRGVVDTPLDGGERGDLTGRVVAHIGRPIQHTSSSRVSPSQIWPPGRPAGGRTATGAMLRGP